MRSLINVASAGMLAAAVVAKSRCCDSAKIGTLTVSEAQACARNCDTKLGVMDDFQQADALFWHNKARSERAVAGQCSNMLLMKWDARLAAAVQYTECPVGHDGVPGAIYWGSIATDGTDDGDSVSVLNELDSSFPKQPVAYPQGQPVCFKAYQDATDNKGQCYNAGLDFYLSENLAYTSDASCTNGGICATESAQCGGAGQPTCETNNDDGSCKSCTLQNAIYERLHKDELIQPGQEGYEEGVPVCADPIDSHCSAMLWNNGEYAGCSFQVGTCGDVTPYYNQQTEGWAATLNCNYRGQEEVKSSSGSTQGDYLFYFDNAPIPNQGYSDRALNDQGYLGNGNTQVDNCIVGPMCSGCPATHPKCSTTGPHAGLCYTTAEDTLMDSYGVTAYVEPVCADGEGVDNGACRKCSQGLGEYSVVSGPTCDFGPCRLDCGLCGQTSTCDVCNPGFSLDDSDACASCDDSDATCTMIQDTVGIDAADIDVTGGVSVGTAIEIVLPVPGDLDSENPASSSFHISGVYSLALAFNQSGAEEVVVLVADGQPSTTGTTDYAFTQAKQNDGSFTIALTMPSGVVPLIDDSKVECEAVLLLGPGPNDLTRRSTSTGGRRSVDMGVDMSLSLSVSVNADGKVAPPGADGNAGAGTRVQPITVTVGLVAAVTVATLSVLYEL